jgi:hypothetical protein
MATAWFEWRMFALGWIRVDLVLPHSLSHFFKSYGRARRQLSVFAAKMSFAFVALFAHQHARIRSSCSLSLVSGCACLAPHSNVHHLLRFTQDTFFFSSSCFCFHRQAHHHILFRSLLFILYSLFCAVFCHFWVGTTGMCDCLPLFAFKICFDFVRRFVVDVKSRAAKLCLRFVANVCQTCPTLPLRVVCSSLNYSITRALPVPFNYLSLSLSLVIFHSSSKRTIEY